MVNSRTLQKKGLKLVEDRTTFRYQSSDEDLAKWRKELPKSYIVICVRLRKAGGKKNYREYGMLMKLVHRLGFTPILLGSHEGIAVPKFAVNLLGKTTINDCIPILQNARLAIGGSTGTLHLASFIGVPHLVWGDSRIQRRYLKTWNPLKTRNIFLSSWQPPISIIRKHLKMMVRKR